MNLRPDPSIPRPAISGSAPPRPRAGGMVNAEVVNDRAKLIMGFPETSPVPGREP